MGYLPRIGIVLAILGPVFLFLGFRERAVASRCSAEPEEISLKDLIARGVEGNPHILLKNFVPCENYVYETKGTVWSGVWVPVVPLESMKPGQITGGKVTNVQAIIYSSKARSEQDLAQRLGHPKVQALITNQLFGIKDKVANLLKQSYPGIDVSKCLIIHEGRNPPGLSGTLFLAGGLVGTLAGLGILGLIGWQWYQEQQSRQRRPKRRRKAREEDEEEEEEEDEEEPIRPRPRRKPVQQTEEEDEDSPPPRPRRRSSEESTRDRDSDPPKRKRLVREEPED